METREQRGLGPWYVGLFFNLSENKTQTELRVHGSLHWFPLIRNLLDERDHWATIMVVGPFYEWNDALGFHTLWSRQTRGKLRRIRRGITLLRYYRARHYDIHLWMQRGQREQINRQIETLRARHYSPTLAKLGKNKRCAQMLCLASPGEAQDAERGTLAQVRQIKRARC